MTAWSILKAGRLGDVASNVRVVSPDDGSILFEDTMNVSIIDLGSIVPTTLRLICKMAKPGRVEVRVRSSGDSEWLRLGSFDVVASLSV